MARAAEAGCGAEGYAPVGSEELEELDAPEELDEPEELEANCATSPANMGSRNGAAGRAPLGRPTHIGSAAIAAGEAASRLCELCWGPASGCSGLGRLACSASRGLPTPWSCRSAVATAAMAVSIRTATHAAARAVWKRQLTSGSLLRRKRGCGFRGCGTLKTALTFPSAGGLLQWMGGLRAEREDGENGRRKPTA